MIVAGVEPPQFNVELHGVWVTFFFAPNTLTNITPENAPENTPETSKEIQENQEYSQNIPPENTQENTPENAQEKKLNVPLQIAQLQIVQLLKSEPKLSRMQLAKKLDLTVDSVKYHLQRLKAAGYIRHTGANKSGHWQILK